MVSKKILSRKGPLKVHLGSGPNYREGWVNLDYNSIDKYDVNHDLDRLPWPFKTNSVDRIFSEHVIEHVRDWRDFVSECHRILKPGGRAVIAAPHSSAPWLNPFHNHAFPVGTFVYWNKFRPSQRFRIAGEHLRYTKEPLLAPLGWIFDLFANLGWFGRRLCQRLWANWVGGFEEIRWVLEKPGT